MKSEKNDKSADFKIFIVVIILIISSSLYYSYTQVELLQDIMPPATAIGLILIMVLVSIWYLMSRSKKK